MSQHSFLSYQVPPKRSWVQRSVSGRPRWLVTVACLLLGVAVGLGVYLLSPSVYESETRVLVLPTTSGVDSAANGGRIITDVVMETEAELARSEQVAATASELLDGQMSTAELVESTTVSVPSNSQVLVISVEAPSAELARDAATAVADAYLLRRSDLAERLTGVATAALETQLELAEQRLERLSATQPTDPGGIALKQAQRELLVNKISDIQSQLLALSVQDTGGGESISDAELPSTPVSPILWLTLGVGLVLGVGLAAVLILLANRDGGSKASHRPLTHRRLRVLATLAQPPDTTLHDAVEAELSRVCREIAAFHGDPGPIAFIGSGDPVSRTRVALLLSQAWAGEFGESIAVVTEPDAERALPDSLQGTGGLVDVLRNRATLKDATAQLPGSGATVMAPGKRQELPSTLHSGHLSRLWSRLDREFGVVLVSSTVEHEQPLGMMTIRTSGRVVLIVQDDPTRDRDLRTMLEALDSLSASDRLVGVVVVEPEGEDAVERGVRSIELSLSPEAADASDSIPVGDVVAQGDGRRT